jgi:hypothetical protein
MKNISLFLLMTLTLIGCGLREEKKITKYNVHPELQAY